MDFRRRSGRLPTGISRSGPPRASRMIKADWEPKTWRQLLADSSRRYYWSRTSSPERDGRREESESTGLRPDSISVHKREDT